MVKIASAAADAGYTKIASKAILMGKKLYIPNEEIELFRYRNTAPEPYYAMLLDKLKLLTESGVTLCPSAELEERILADVKNDRAATSGGGGAYSVVAQIETALNKKLITEKDVLEAGTEGTARLIIGRRAIVTELARDYAREHSIQIIRN